MRRARNNRGMELDWNDEREYIVGQQDLQGNRRRRGWHVCRNLAPHAVIVPACSLIR